MTSPTLLALESFPDQLSALYESFPPDSVAWIPRSWEGVPSEALSAIEQICHVRDIEVDGYQVRLRRTLDEDNPILPSLDTDALVRERAYAEQDAAQVLAAFRGARTETIKLLRGLSSAQLARPAVFEGYGPVTLRGLMHFLCSHDQQHLAGLQWLLGKLSSRTTAANAA